MRSIDDIIEDWKTEYGTLAYGKDGSFYRYIDFKIKKNLLLNLAQTMIDEGYTKADLLDESGNPNIAIRNNVINGCEAPDGASNRAKSKIKKGKDITAKQWKEVLKEFFRGPVSTFKAENRTPEVEPTEFEKETKPEKPIEIDPSDRIKMDTSDIVEAPLDLEFLAELGIDTSSAGEK